MPEMRLIEGQTVNAVAAALREIRRPLLLDGLVLDTPPETEVVRDIIADVRHRGDTAVSEITARVDAADVPPDAVRVPVERVVRAQAEASRGLMEAARHAIRAVSQFQEHLLTARTDSLALHGRTLSVRSRPVRRVGVCVPGASAPLLSSAIHSVVPAQVAGVQEIAIAAPPRHNNDVHPAILAVAGELGVTEVYRMGGAQAIAAMAMGTERVARVDKIVGPGNVYGQLAKRFLFGVVDIDMFAGPSEVLIIADSSARPDYVAADMLAQAEHDPGCAILLTDERRLADRVMVELDAQLVELARPQGAIRCLAKYGAMVVIRDMDEAVVLANDIAPEHLEIATRNPGVLGERIDSAGAIFLGHFTPESAGDYVAGPSHVLPTGGTARFWSGVSALGFLRRTSLIEYTAEGLARDAAAIDALARAECLEAHARSATIRVQDK
ncbi:MAG: histidinol dehydrogenase [Phycisphaerae bacterium]|nr:histidinol dehydrogenase [Phycisphaerae bacterium]